MINYLKNSNKNTIKLIIFILLQSQHYAQANDPLGLVGGKWYSFNEVNRRDGDDYFYSKARLTRILIFESYKKGKYKIKYGIGKDHGPYYLDANGGMIYQPPSEMEYSRLKGYIRKEKFTIDNDDAFLDNGVLKWIYFHGPSDESPDTTSFTRRTDEEYNYIRDRLEYKSRQFSNPKFYSNPSYGRFRWYKNPPLDQEPIPIEGMVFGKKSKVWLAYKSDGLLEHIIFTDINNPKTGNPPATLKDFLEPEILEKQFKDMSSWAPVQYLPENNIMIFGGDKKRSDNPSYHFLYLNEGRVESKKAPDFRNKNDWGSKNGYFSHIFSNTFEGKLLIHYYGKTDKNSVGHKYYAQNTTLIYFDLINDVVLDSISTVGHVYNGSRNNSSSAQLHPEKDNQLIKRIKDNDEKLWFSILSGNVFLLSEKDTYGKLFSTDKIKKWIENFSMRIGYVDNDNFKFVYTVDGSDSNLKFFELIKQNEGEIKYVSENGLLAAYDEYGSLFVFNLNKNALQERKYGSIQIKNNMLSEEDNKYLSQFKL
tara:strand:- start:353 stop:1957 length:1605 start_codon:yes stop_codon:yes gene_type:complete